MTGARPPAALVHSIVATELTHPRLPTAPGDDRRARRGSATPEDIGLDLPSLNDFAGLAEKVRHNQIRHDLELTFRLLRLYGIEIAFFRDYVPTSLERRRQGLTKPGDRLAGLAEFAPLWAGADVHRCVVRDVLVHECILAAFRREDGTVPGGSRARPQRLDGVERAEPAGPTCVPVLNGTVIVRSMICDPDQVAAVLRDREPDLAAIRLQSRTAVYHRAPSSRVRILSTDAGVGELLLAIDADSDVRTLAGRLMVSDPLVPTLVQAYAQLCQLGVIVLAAPRGSA